MVTETINVEVVYALPHKQTLLSVKVAPGCSIAQALDASGLWQRHPELDPATLKVGIYSRLVPLSTALAGGERIEIYRPLTADPREMRRKRAEKAKDEGRAVVVGVVLLVAEPPLQDRQSRRGDVVLAHTDPRMVTVAMYFSLKL